MFYTDTCIRTLVGYTHTLIHRYIITGIMFYRYRAYTDIGIRINRYSGIRVKAYTFYTITLQ
jgi:hypothetical protein